MKRAIIICLVIISSFCSCASREQESSPIKTGDAFSCTAEIELDGRQFTCDLTYKNSANAELEVILPEDLAGVRFSLTNGELLAHYGDSKFTVSSKNNPAVSTAKLIFTALGHAMSSNELKTDKKNGISYTEGEISSHNYRLNFNSKNGLPESFEIKSLNFSCKFKNFKFL